MTTLAAFLLTITGSIAARALTALGIGIFSYAAITTLLNTVITGLTTAYTGLNVTVLAILNLAGTGKALGILIAALLTRASLSAIKKMRPI